MLMKNATLVFMSCSGTTPNKSPVSSNKKRTAESNFEHSTDFDRCFVCLWTQVNA